MLVQITHLSYFSSAFDSRVLVVSGTFAFPLGPLAVAFANTEFSCWLRVNCIGRSTRQRQFIQGLAGRV